MAEEFAPETMEELSGAMRDCGKRKRTIELGGNFSKTGLGGEIHPADVRISTRKLGRILTYEPNDLTISVEAGLPYGALCEALEQHRQMLPLDPPFAAEGTVGGVVAANLSGPRRRRYGTARDMVIGMAFVTVEGKRVRSGGMVVKNVTGLDMAKLLIGSYGTLAAIATVNFKVFPKPESTGTVAFSSDSLEKLALLRREIVGSVLQPAALDLLNARAMRLLGVDASANYVLLAESHGNRSAVLRCQDEYLRLAVDHEVQGDALPAEAAEALWGSVSEFCARLTAMYPGCWMLRASALPARLAEVIAEAERSEHGRAVVARAATGVAYVGCRDISDAGEALTVLRQKGVKTAVESSPPGSKEQLPHWQASGREMEIMERIKKTFDPDGLLNRGRLHNQL